MNIHIPNIYIYMYIQVYNYTFHWRNKVNNMSMCNNINVDRVFNPLFCYSGNRTRSRKKLLYLATLKFNKRYQFSLISFCSTVWIFKFLVRQLKKRCISEDKLLKLISENILCAEIHCKTWYLYAMHMTFYYDVNFNHIYTIHVYV